MQPVNASFSANTSKTSWFGRLGGEWQLMSIILSINLLQSIITPLLNDEPYYWIYAQYLSTGYFDHPPLIGWLISSGSTWLPGEIGVRLFNTLLGSFTFLFLYKIIRYESGGAVNHKLMMLLLGSSLFLNLYSFLAIPDTPLLFFGALFLYQYRRFLQDASLLNTLLLGIITALLLYAKYHGILLIGFTVLSNLKLFTKWQFYVVFVTAATLMLPHVYWQIQHDYPTIKFHLLNRETDFKLKHILSYAGEQLAVTGPVILLLFSVLYKAKNQFQKALKFNVAGIFIFFLLSAFKKNINVHWTAIAFLPMLCLSYFYIAGMKRRVRLVYGLLILNLAIVIFCRLNFMFNWVRIPHFNDVNPKVMAATLLDRSGGRPLVFEDNYNEPAYCTFYQAQACFAVNTLNYKRTQYNYLPQLERHFQNKAVTLVTEHPVNERSAAVDVIKGHHYFVTSLPAFTSFTAVNIVAPNLKTLKAGQQTTIPVTIQNPEKDTRKVQLWFTLINKSTDERFTFRYDKPVRLGQVSQTQFSIQVPSEKGDYRGIFSVRATDDIQMGFNSDIYKIKIE